MSNNQPEIRKFYNCIVIYKKPDGSTAGAKYHNQECDDWKKWRRQKIFFKNTFPTATHVNLYPLFAGGKPRQEKFNK